MEKDCSDEAATMVDRTSRAIQSIDLQRGSTQLHVDDGSDDEKETKMQDLCPSWIG